MEAESDFGSDGPFFLVVREGPDARADGEDSFDRLADDVVLEYVVSAPGHSERVEGRRGIVDRCRGHDDQVAVRAADDLRVHPDLDASVVVLEREAHGASVQTGRPHDSRFVSTFALTVSKFTHWRDHLDPVAVSDAATAGPAAASIATWRSRQGSWLRRGVLELSTGVEAPRERVTAAATWSPSGFDDRAL